MIFSNSFSFSTQRHLAPSFIYTHTYLSPLSPTQHYLHLLQKIGTYQNKVESK